MLLGFPGVGLCLHYPERSLQLIELTPRSPISRPGGLLLCYFTSNSDVTIIEVINTEK